MKILIRKVDASEMSSCVMKKLKNCAICGTPSSRYRFYSVQSCESCKQFFRRIVLRQKEFFCKKETCNKTVEKCKGCRLDKCLQVGMEPTMVKANKTEIVQKFVTRLLERRDAFVKGMATTTMMQYSSIPSHKLDEFVPLEHLMEMRKKANRIRNSPTGISPQYLAHFSSLEQLIGSGPNLLDNHEQFSEGPPEPWDRDADIGWVLEYGLYKRPFARADCTKGMLISIDMAKTMPAFRTLSMGDKVALISAMALPASLLFLYQGSAEMNAEAAQLPNGTVTFQIYGAIASKRSDNVMLNLSRRIFVDPVQSFTKASLGQDEFILLVALILSNAAVSGLSRDGQRVLEREAERYGKALLWVQQRKFGEQPGALRYMESLQLLGLAIKCAQRDRELVVYVDSIHEQGKFIQILHPSIAPLIAVGHKL